MKIKGHNILITGGASGIGRIMGKMALQKGASLLVIWDINQANIDIVCAELSSYGRVCGYRVDVSDKEDIAKTYEKMRKECGAVDILIQCAGIIATNRTFDLNTCEDIERTMKVNAIAPMLVAHSVIGDMIKRDQGHICNIASAAGMVSNPKMSVYASSKWAVIGWSDSLRIELHNMKSRVRMTTVAPYYINTGMFDGVKSKIFPILDPEKTSASILKAIEKEKDFIGLPWGFHFIRFWQGILPTRVFDWLFGEVFGIYHTMDNFTGRTSK